MGEEGQSFLSAQKNSLWFKAGEEGKVNQVADLANSLLMGSKESSQLGEGEKMNKKHRHRDFSAS